MPGASAVADGVGMAVPDSPARGISAVADGMFIARVWPCNRRAVGDAEGAPKAGKADPTRYSMPKLADLNPLPKAHNALYIVGVVTDRTY